MFTSVSSVWTQCNHCLRLMTLCLPNPDGLVPLSCKPCITLLSTLSQQSENEGLSPILKRCHYEYIAIPNPREK